MRKMVMAAQTNKCKLTKCVVENAEPDSTKRTFLWDTEVTGFSVRIYPTGKKTYFLQYRNQDNVTKKIKLGVHGAITTELAREKAVNLSLSINSGEDPSVKMASPQNHSMNELGEMYLNLHAKVKKKPACFKEDEGFLKDIILKRYGHLNVEAISALDLQKLQSDLEKTPYKANRVRALLSKMFNLAIQWGWRSDNPIKGVEKYQEHQRHRWLSDEELQKLWSVLDTYSNQSVANAIHLLLFTGSRRNEVLHAT